MSFVGGKLNLKGGAPLAGGVKKKSKKKSSDKASGSGGGDAAAAAAAGTSAAATTAAGYVPPPPPEGADRRTEAEKRRDAKLAALEEKRLRELAARGYRDRVKAFNEHLASLSEHHDIPKVGPG
jgi:protein FAM32A